MSRTSISDRQWLFTESDGELTRRLSVALSITPLTAQLLVNRDIHDAQEAAAFLKPSLADLSEPVELPGVERGAERIAEAVRGGERIVIYGDYDVDGTTAIGVLVRCLRMLGAKVDYYVPNRLDEGYGLNMAAMEKLVEGGAQLLISVDCGVTAFKEAGYLAERGVDLIVTDHHEPMDDLPQAVAIIDPKLGGPKSARHISGVGVAFKLALVLAQHFSPGQRVTPEFREFLGDALALVALGTVADVVPLVGENRAMVDFGLKRLRNTCMPGVLALVDTARLSDGPVTPRQVAFQIAPMLNAAGRMSDAGTAVELFITEDTLTAHKLAAQLEAHNRDRRKVGECMLAEAMEEASRFADEPVLVLAQPGWHSGVIGIIAGKLAEEFNKPAIVFSVEEELSQGSARSIPEINMFETLKGMEDLLVSFGGHSQAAGLKIMTDRLDQFRERLAKAVWEALDGHPPRRKLRLDAEVRLADLNEAAVRDMERLAPFGSGNPQPLLMARDVEIIGQPKRMGSDGQHISFFVRDSGVSLRVVGFSFPQEYISLLERGRLCDIVFEPRTNHWNGSTSVELFLKDIAFES